MENFVTLFDSLFLPQGLALHMSMERHMKQYTLWILCVDDASFLILSKLKLKNVKLLHLDKFETKELKKIRLERTNVEYLWTLTPFAPRFVIETKPSISRITYIDADLCFYNNPAPIFNELKVSKKNILITEHAFDPEYDQSATSGRFCVQFIIFEGKKGRDVRQWWEKRCVDWCYNRFEEGKFGDQKYLEIWPSLFPNSVHILENKSFALGPWNAKRFPYSECIFYHFHGLRITGRNTLFIGNYYLPKPVIDHIYKPYSIDLKEACRMLGKSGYIFKKQKEELTVFSTILDIIKSLLKSFLRRIQSGRISF